MPPFALTDGIPEEDSNGRREWNVYDLQNAKSVKESMDAVHGFCGLMAGFEGFIINDYVKKSDYDDENFSIGFQWGLFLLIISFILNIAAATASFLWGVFLREGHYRLWFMKIVGRATKFMATGAVFSFSLGVLFFIDTIGLDKEMLIPIYSSSAIIFSFIMSVFIYTMVVATAVDTPDMYTKVMDFVN